MKLSIYITLLNLTLCHFITLSQDSIPTHQLNEVIVLGDRGWIENGIICYIPTKTEKKLSNSPATLIKSMHLPFLKEKDGSIVSMAGEILPIFINGIKADNIDLATFWPNEVKRVEYIENPTDPSYGGVHIAVNFVMTHYEVGGISKINLFQKIPNNGYYTGSSKIEYKKMTYGILFSGDYYRDHRSDMSGETIYKDIFYNNEPYEVLNRYEDNHSFNREESIRLALNTRYLTDNKRITHTIALKWNQNPGSGSNGYNIWSENIFGSSSSFNSYESKNISPQILGNYYFILSNKWYLSGLWSYSYTRNENLSFNQIGLANIIYNSNYENVNSCKFIVQPSFVLSDNWSFQLKTECHLDWFSTHYRGSANTEQNQYRQELLSSCKINWIPTRFIRMYLEPGISTSLWQIGDISQHEIIPTVNASIDWNPSRKFSFNGTLSFFMRPISASESNPVLIRSSELLWVLGNPYLKNLTSWDTYIQNTYLTTNWFSVSFGFGYVKTYNNIIPNYTPASTELGGLIKKTVNTRPVDNIRANLEFRGSFFDDNLSIGISPQGYYSYVRGDYKNQFKYFTISGSIDYTLKNCRLSLWYEGPYKDLSMAGMEESWKQDNWNASITYGNNNLYLDLRIEDIFNNKRKSWIHFSSPHYISKYHYSETGRSISINLTYTFGYGKKVDPYIDIKGPDSTKTSILSVK